MKKNLQISSQTFCSVRRHHPQTPPHTPRIPPNTSRRDRTVRGDAFERGEFYESVNPPPPESLRSDGGGGLSPVAVQRGRTRSRAFRFRIIRGFFSGLAEEESGSRPGIPTQWLIQSRDPATAYKIASLFQARGRRQTILMQGTSSLFLSHSPSLLPTPSPLPHALGDLTALTTAQRNERKISTFYHIIHL